VTGRVLALAVCLAALAACTGRTQVVVRVDADDAVRSDPRFHHVRVKVRALSDPPTTEARLDEEVTPLAAIPGQPVIPWPFDMVLAPEGDDPSRRYRVLVTAEDRNDNVFVSLTAISGYIPGQTRVLHMRLTADCRDVLCGDGLTCRRSVCESAEIAPLALPALGQPPPDVTAWDGAIADDAGGMDAGDMDAGDMDAGDMDAGDMDAGDMDAGDMDAGAFDASEPDATVPDAGVPFTTIELLTMASSESVLHGGSVCSARDGSFMAAAERLALDLALWDDTRGARTLPVTLAALSIGCRPDGTQLLLGTGVGIVVRASATRDVPWSENGVVDPGAVGTDGLGQRSRPERHLRRGRGTGARPRRGGRPRRRPGVGDRHADLAGYDGHRRWLRLRGGHQRRWPGHRGGRPSRGRRERGSGRSRGRGLDEHRCGLRLPHDDGLGSGTHGHPHQVSLAHPQRAVR
jgi:hypothetical protein